MGSKVFYAHSRKNTARENWQPLREHLRNTAELAAKLGLDAGVSNLARIAAMLHDLGKYSAAFQARLEGARRSMQYNSHAEMLEPELLRNVLEHKKKVMKSYSEEK